MQALQNHLAEFPSHVKPRATNTAAIVPRNMSGAAVKCSKCKSRFRDGSELKSHLQQNPSHRQPRPQNAVTTAAVPLGLVQQFAGMAMQGGNMGGGRLAVHMATTTETVTERVPRRTARDVPNTAAIVPRNMSGAAVKCSKCKSRFRDGSELKSHLQQNPSHRQPRPQNAVTTAAVPLGLVQQFAGMAMQGGNMGGGRLAVHMATTTETVTERVPRRTARDVQFVIDTSGSMNGSKIREARNGIFEVFSALEPHDTVTLHAFDTCSRCVLPRTAKRDISDFRSHLERIQAVGNSTAFYDAVTSCIDALRSGRRQLEMIVATDGDDNASRAFTFESTKAKLERPGKANFHFFLLGVGVGSYTQGNLQRLCGTATNRTYVNVANAAEIPRAFRMVRDAIVRRTSTTRSTFVAGM